MIRHIKSLSIGLVPVEYCRRPPHTDFAAGPRIKPHIVLVVPVPNIDDVEWYQYPHKGVVLELHKQRVVPEL